MRRDSESRSSAFLPSSGVKRCNPLRPFDFARYDDTEFHVETSIGVACFPTDGDDAETLLRRADLAMLGLLSRK